MIVPVDVDSGIDLLECQIFIMCIVIVHGMQSGFAVVCSEMFRCDGNALFGGTVKHIFGYGADHQRRAEHELIIDGICRFVIFKIHRQAAHDGISILRYLMCQRINVGDQTVPEIVEFHEHRRKIPEFPYFARRL